MDGAGTRRRTRRGKKRKHLDTSIEGLLDEELLADNDGGDGGETSADGIGAQKSSRPIFPESGWDTSSAILPKDLSLGVIIDHLRRCGKNASATVKKPFTRGFNFFFWSYIHGVRCCKDGDGTYYLLGNCWASQAKKESYKLECVLKAVTSTYLMSVKYAHCTCTAGIAGSCHHFVALLLSVEHCAKICQDTPAEQTCTTEQQRWGPRPRQVVAQPVSRLVIERAKAGMEESESVRKASSLFEARGGTMRTLSKDSLLSLEEGMRQEERSYPLLNVLPKDGTFYECPSSMGPVPYGSVLSYQLLNADHVTVPEDLKRPSRPGRHTPPPSGMGPEPGPSNTTAFCAIPMPKAAAPDDIFARPLLLSKAHAVERRTRSQGASDLWKKLREVTLTSSKFHLVAHRKEVDESFLTSLFAAKDLSHVPAISHGQRWEERARLDYADRMRETGHTDLQVRRCGLLLHPAYEYLGASPDGQVFDPSSTDKHGLLEIKCPYTAYQQDLTPEEACDQSSSFCSTLDSLNQPKLRKDHAYYYQVQGQLAISGLAWCDFVLWTGPRRMSVERVMFDDEFWNDYLKRKLQHFYIQHIEKSIQ